jgi:hypothetical protein
MFKRATAMVAIEDRGSRTDGTLHCGMQTSGVQAQVSRVQVLRSWTLASAYETASSWTGLEVDTSRDGKLCSTTLNPTVLQPDANPWDFDESE